MQTLVTPKCESSCSLKAYRKGKVTDLKRGKKNSKYFSSDSTFYFFQDHKGDVEGEKGDVMENYVAISNARTGFTKTFTIFDDEDETL